MEMKAISLITLYKMYLMVYRARALGLVKRSIQPWHAVIHRLVNAPWIFS